MPIRKISFCSSVSRLSELLLPYAVENDLEKRKDIVIKAADKSGAVVVWRADLCQKEALRQLSGTSFYAKVDKDLTLITKTLSKCD